MGCVNGKPVLSDEDLDFIANHTAISRDLVDKVRKKQISKIAIKMSLIIIISIKSFTKNQIRIFSI